MSEGKRAHITLKPDMAALRGVVRRSGEMEGNKPMTLTIKITEREVTDDD